MMFDITKKYFQHLDGLHLVLVVDVRESVKLVSEVLKIISILYPVKS